MASWGLGRDSPMLMVACRDMTSGVTGVNSSIFRLARFCAAQQALEVCFAHRTRNKCGQVAAAARRCWGHDCLHTKEMATSPDAEAGCRHPHLLSQFLRHGASR